MITLIRSILKSISSATNRIFTADGRANEEIQGRIFQHFGFRSQPPAGVEQVVLKQGNNYVSVAESDGSYVDNNFNVPELEDQEVRLYNDKNIIQFKTDMKLESLNDINIFSSGTKRVEVKGSDPGTTYYLVTEEFLTFFLGHTHTSATSGSPTSTPLYPGTTPITKIAIEAAHGLTTVLKAE